jgi:hypothetical protein
MVRLISRPFRRMPSAFGQRMRPRRMLKREMEELSIRQSPDRNASPQRELVVRSDKGIIPINGQRFSERELGWLKLAVQCMVAEE